MYKTQYFQNYVSFLNEFFKNLKMQKYLVCTLVGTIF